MLNKVAGTLMRQRLKTTGDTVALHRVIVRARLPHEESKVFSHAVELVETAKLLDRESSLSSFQWRLRMGALGINRVVKLAIRHEGDYGIGLSKGPGMMLGHFDFFLHYY